MRVLVVKLTSMGDILHVMPALTDLARETPGLVVDWMVEESFREIPAWHPSVDRVIPVATRRWRKFRWSSIREFLKFRSVLVKQKYDVIIDAQGLIKSAVFARFAGLKSGGIRIGFSADSIKESLAAKLYQKTVHVERDQHAIDRLRQLFAGGFAYQLAMPLSYGLDVPENKSTKPRDSGTVMFFHATTWRSKHLPEQVWRRLIELAGEDGYRVLVVWGNRQEKQRAERLAQGQANAVVLDQMTLTEIKEQLEQCSGAIAVDTGLGHLAAALGTPCASVYGSTNSKLTGAVGDNQVVLQSEYPCSPCMSKQCLKLTAQVIEPPCYLKTDSSSRVQAENIWQALFEKII